MNINKIKYTIISILLIICVSSKANLNIKLESIDINTSDKISLQKGSKIFFETCVGCHSLKYMRYIELAKGIGISPIKDKSIENLTKEIFLNLNNKININDPISNFISKNDAIKWFGKNPPDLSLISKYRSKNWIYSYMKSFYKDSSKPTGVNNLIFPDVGMPHVLVNLQGIQKLKKIEHNNSSLLPKDMLELEAKGILSEEEYNLLLKDLITFLAYVSEPTEQKRYTIGYFVVSFTILLSILLYFLKREYWKDINYKKNANNSN